LLLLLPSLASPLFPPPPLFHIQTTSEKICDLNSNCFVRVIIQVYILYEKKRQLYAWAGAIPVCCYVMLILIANEVHCSLVKKKEFASLALVVASS
jgi:hypothetical protein